MLETKTMLEKTEKNIIVITKSPLSLALTIKKIYIFFLTHHLENRWCKQTPAKPKNN